MTKFQAGQLLSLLQQIQIEQFTGVISVEVVVNVDSKRRSRILAFWKGMITFIGRELLTQEALAELVKQKLNISYIDAVLKISASRVRDESSVRELLEFISRFGIFKWDELEAVFCNSAVLELEQLLPHSGILKVETTAKFDLNYGDDHHGFGWDHLQQTLAQRRRSWMTLAPMVTSRDAVPLRSQKEFADIPQAIRHHLDQWVDGQRSLQNIAEQIDKDPLTLAKLYANCVQKGWITFKSPLDKAPATAATQSRAGEALGFSKDLPIILSVDDSPIVQTIIKRALSDHYQLLLANNAVDALNLLNNHPIALLLLDVTMPDIDGLELCRTIRGVGKFRDLPIIMLTAKDGLIDKVKGQFAGSTQYLTKPIDREKLLPVIEKYLPSKVAI
jgi:CheY-like chemotaxis protein